MKFRRLLPCAALFAGARTASAQHPVRETLTWVAGAATGLVVHESGHVFAGWTFTAHPGVKSIHYAGVPFFAVTHQHVPRRTEFVISSAGFWTQHAGAEWILTRYPNLRRDGPTLAKGMLLFDITTSLLYTGGAAARLGPPEGDALGMTNSLGAHGWPEPLVGAFILAPALFDGVRYFAPGRRWATWGARGSKVAFMALTVFAGSPR